MMPLRTSIFVLLALLTVAAAEPQGPFENEIKAFEKSDEKSPPPQDAFLFVGSSSIRKWESLAKDFPDIKTINRGFGGSQIADSTRYANRIVLPYHPKVIVFYAGDNDIAGGRSPEQVLEDYKAFVAKVHDAQPKTPIIFISIKASLARWALADKIKEADAKVKEFSATSKMLDFVDVFTPMLGGDGKPRKELLVEDGLHLSPKGYELWTSLVRKHLDPYIEKPSPDSPTPK